MLRNAYRTPAVIDRRYRRKRKGAPSRISLRPLRFGLRFSGLREIRSPSSAFILQASFFILQLRFLVSRTAGQTESDEGEPVVRVVEVVAVGNSRAVGVAAPATATEAAEGGICDILAPLNHIPAHVIDS